MNIPELMEQLDRAGATLLADGNEVTVSFPEEHRHEIEQLGSMIRRLKPDLLQALRERTTKPNPEDPNGMSLAPVDRSSGELKTVPITTGPAKCPRLPVGVK